MTDKLTITKDEEKGYIGELRLEQIVKLDVPLRFQFLLLWLCIDISFMCLLMYSILEKLNMMVTR